MPAVSSSVRTSPRPKLGVFCVRAEEKKGLESAEVGRWEEEEDGKRKGGGLARNEKKSLPKLVKK